MGSARTSRKRSLLRPLIAAVGAIALSVLTLPTAHADNGVNFDLKGFATGQTVHVGALELAGTRVVDAEVAWAGATVDATADGLKTGKLNEMNRIFQPGLVGKHTQARGSGLEIGLGTTPTTTANTIILAPKSEANAPPSASVTHDLLGPLSVPPLAYASALASNAVANWNASPLVPGVCVVGNDLSRGHGYAANVQLIDAGNTQANGQFGKPLLQTSDTIAPNPQRNVSQTTTRERLVPNGLPNGFGLMSEVRETIAPVTLIADNTDPSNPRALTIEVLGEWVLRTVAKGTSGGATVFYGPAQASPETPILRILDKTGVQAEIKTQDLFGPGKIPTLIDLSPLAQIAIGENPRAISKPGVVPDPTLKPTTAADGSLSSAAVDVARVVLLNQPNPAQADIRIGHMEASAQVPANGGITCPIPVTKAANPSSIQVDPGSPDTSRVTITVHNVYDCDLTSTVLTDTITQKESDPDFKLVASNPDPSSVEGDGKSATLPTDNIRSAKVTWDLGTIPKGTDKSVTLDIKSATRGGVIRDVANAAGTFKNCVGSAAIGLDVANLNLTGLSPIVEVAIETPRTGPSASRTTAAGAAIALVATSLALVARRRRTA